MAKIYGVIIIGSGPAGYTAAIYAARADLSVLVRQSQQQAMAAVLLLTRNAGWKVRKGDSGSHKHIPTNSWIHGILLGARESRKDP